MLTGRLQTINALQANWAWSPSWLDSGGEKNAGRTVKFTREINLSSSPTRALLHFSADTRYKLYVNGRRVAVGPSRSSPWIWYYDTLDIAPYLHAGDNEICFIVLRYFAASRGAMPFERTSTPGLTVIGNVETATETVPIDDWESWETEEDFTIEFPMGLIDDGFLHVRFFPFKVSEHCFEDDDRR